MVSFVSVMAWLSRNSFGMVRCDKNKCWDSGLQSAHVYNCADVESKWEVENQSSVRRDLDYSTVLPLTLSMSLQQSHFTHGNISRAQIFPSQWGVALAFHGCLLTATCSTGPTSQTCVTIFGTGRPKPFEYPASTVSAKDAQGLLLLANYYCHSAFV